MLYNSFIEKVRSSQRTMEFVRNYGLGRDSQVAPVSIRTTKPMFGIICPRSAIS